MDNVTQPQAGITIRAARVVAARPPEVYQALTDPEVVRTWWGRTEKAKVSECAAEVRVGGAFRYTMQNAGGSACTASGTYTEVFPPHKLGFTWDVAAGDGQSRETRVTVEFHDLKDGTTRVVVTHQGLPSPQSAHLHSAGWHDLIQDLSLHFAGT